MVPQSVVYVSTTGIALATAGVSIYLYQSLHGSTGVKLASLPIVHLERLPIRQTGVE
jgi:hypothetical protein